MEMVLSQPGNLAQFEALKAQLFIAGFREVVVTYSNDAARIGVVADEDRRHDFETIVRLLDPDATPF